MAISEVPIGGLIKVVWNFFEGVYRRFFPKKYGYTVAPSNILEVIQPYTSKGKVLELLGRPHSADNVCDSYRFKNALLQIRYDDNESIDAVVLGSLSLRWPNRFRIFPLDYVLGATKYADVRWSENDEMMSKEMSSKFFSVSRTSYFGFPGRYLYFTFSSISAATYPQLGIDVFFHDRDNNESLEYCSPTPYADQRFNLVTISRNDDGMMFSWAEFM